MDHLPEFNTVALERERCKGCYLCIKACPNELFLVDKNPNQAGHYPVLMENAQYCLNCMRCVDICPDQALTPPVSAKLNWQGVVFWGSLKWHQRQNKQGKP
ncbi:MAG: 4Fe-4S binding protein [Candidatus Sericytochromatia bacterium]|nr:4Fe-4S binding protein [Candidatus Sericytochromatia bacterium]